MGGGGGGTELSLVPVKPDADAGRGVAVPTCVDETHVGHGVVVGDGVGALAVIARRAIAGAGGTCER